MYVFLRFQENTNALDAGERLPPRLLSSPRGNWNLYYILITHNVCLTIVRSFFSDTHTHTHTYCMSVIFITTILLFILIDQ